MFKGPPQDGKKVSRRITAPKARGGCVTCKARRVKCDETKPACQRCLRFWGKCEGGYVHPKPYTRYIASKAQPAPRTLKPLLPRRSLSQPSIPVPLYQSPAYYPTFRNESENRYFQIFRTDTVAGLPGLFTTTLWETVMLQACHSNSFVLDAVIAIGALSSCGRNLTCSNPSARSSASPIMCSSSYQFALQQYGLAVRKMRKSINSDEKHIREALLGCLLVICFEILQGNYVQALTHSISGHALFTTWRSAHPHPNPQLEGLTSPNPKVVEDDLLLAFGRLDLQVMAYVDPRPPSAHQTLMKEGDETVANIPAVFENVEQARKYHELIARRTSHFLASLTSQSPSDSVPTVDVDLGLGAPALTFHAESEIYTSIPTSQKPHRRYGEDLGEWLKAFAPLYKRLERGEGREATAARMLRVQALTSRIMLLSSLLGSEDSLDRFLLEYKEIVSLCTLISRAPAFRTETFKFDLGIVNSLRLVGKWCRDAPTRRSAIALLREGRVREGLYDAMNMAATEEFVMSLEEEGRDGEGIIRREMRWRIVGVKLDCLARSCEVKAERFGRKLNGEKDVRETVVKW